MSELKIVLPGAVFQSEVTSTQIPIAVGAGTFAAANNIATLTFAAAHGLTLTPAVGTAPNFFFQMNGASAQTGVGTLNGPIFRILAIPSTTTIQFYTTVTAATVTSANVVPVFIPNFVAQVNSGFLGGPTSGAAPGTVNPGPLQASGFVNLALGANCTMQYNPDNTSIIEDQTSGNTLATAPTFRTLVAASTSTQIWCDGAGAMAIFASGSAGTSRWSEVA